MIHQGIYPHGIILPIFVKCPLTRNFIEVQKNCRKCPVNGGLQGDKETYQVCFHFPRFDPAILQNQ